MNRRNFLRASGSAGIALLATPLVIGTLGCTEQEVVNYLNTVLAAAKSILSVTVQSDPWYQDLVAAISALEATEGTWNAKTISGIVISALNAIDAVLAVIPITAVYSPLIDIVTTAIETILTLFVPAAMAASSYKGVRNPHRGRVALKKPGHFQSDVGAFKQQFNDAVVALQLPASAKI